MTIRILVADDQALMRSALRTCLTAVEAFEVVGEARNGAEAVALARRLTPDVVVMDIRMPVLDGVAATRRLRLEQPLCKILVLTTFEVDESIVEALRAGASGFLLKDATPEELTHAVHVVSAGQALLSPTVTRRLLDRYAHRLPSFEAPDEALVTSLTPRELSVLMLVAKGRSNADIGHDLNLAVSSVKSHVSHLLMKLGVADRVQLVVLSYESGLVQRHFL